MRILTIAISLLVGGCMLNAATSGRFAVTDRDEGGYGTQVPEGASYKALQGAKFSPRDRSIVRDFFKTPHPSLINRERLGRGVGVGAVLAPTISGRVLPTELEIRLSRLAPGYDRRIVGRDIVLYERRHRTILDIIYDALP